MKSYLISYWNGVGISSCIAKTNDGYKPSIDDCRLLKTVVEKDAAEEYKKYGKSEKMTTDNLQIVAISNLDI